MQRRRFLRITTTVAAAFAAATTWPMAGASWAAQTLQLKTSNPAIASLALAILGRSPARTVTLVKGMRLDSVSINDAAPVALTNRILLKGSGSARWRFLDDARNATRVAGNLRDLIAKQAPSLAKDVQTNHKTWARAFTRKVMKWSKQLKAGPWQGKAVNDTHGRAYLLEWAGVQRNATAKSQGPSGLASMPEGPISLSATSYDLYIAQIVKSMLANS